MNFYEVLGVSRTATVDEIRIAFRRAAKQHHPDREGGDADKMADVNRAFDTLHDPEKRELYDRLGEASMGPSIQDEAKATLAELIRGAIDAPEGEFISSIRAKVHKAQTVTNNAITAAPGRLATLKRRLLKVRVKEGVENLAAPMLDLAIQGLEQEIPRMKRTQDVLAVVLQMLDAYSCDEFNPTTWAGLGTAFVHRPTVYVHTGT